ncbi:MAG: hypothetical protein ACOWWH_12650 [Eubacteriaceae bacterium]
MVETIILPSGKKVGSQWLDETKSKFVAVMTYRMPYKRMIPSKAKDVIDEDWKYIQKLKGKTEKKKEEGAE